MAFAVRSDDLIVAGIMRLRSELPVSDTWKRNIEGRLMRGDSGKVSRTHRLEAGWADWAGGGLCVLLVT